MTGDKVAFVDAEAAAAPKQVDQQPVAASLPPGKVPALAPRPLERAILEPLDPMIERRLPRRRKPLRPRQPPQLVQRLERNPDRPRRLGDDPGGGERCDERALPGRGDRIAARARGEVGRKVQQRIVRVGRRGGERGGRGAMRRVDGGGDELGGWSIGRGRIGQWRRSRKAASRSPLAEPASAGGGM